MWCLQSAILCAITTKTTNHKLQTPTPKYRLNKPQSTDLTNHYRKCSLLTISIDLGTKLLLVLAVDTRGIWNFRSEGSSWQREARMCPGSLAIIIAFRITRRSYNALTFVCWTPTILSHTFTVLNSTFLFFKLRPPNQFRKPKVTTDWIKHLQKLPYSIDLLQVTVISDEKVYSRLAFPLNDFGIGVKRQSVIKNCPQIFVLKNPVHLFSIYHLFRYSLWVSPEINDELFCFLHIQV